MENTRRHPTAWERGSFERDLPCSHFPVNIQAPLSYEGNGKSRASKRQQKPGAFRFTSWLVSCPRPGGIIREPIKRVGFVCEARAQFDGCGVGRFVRHLMMTKG